MAGAPIVVVGGGIAGLAAAWELVTQGRSVKLVEADDRLGGKIRTESFAGVALDVGADAFVDPRGAAVGLCGELDLGAELVAPANGGAYLWADGRLRRLPPGLVMGVPTDLSALARTGLVSPMGVGRAGLDLILPARPVAGDEAVGSLVRRRLGDEVAERLVDPLVGGINAGHADRLSARACAPDLAVAGQDRSLIRGARARREQAPGAEGPAFRTLPGGLTRLVDRLAERLAGAGAAIHLGTRVEAIGWRDGGWSVAASRNGARTHMAASGVVLATPAFASADLLDPLLPDAAANLAAIDHASVALVTYAYPREIVGRPLAGSGFLVPRDEGLLMTACSWASSKWAHLGETERVLLRVSAGRHGDERALAFDDETLASRLHGELSGPLELAGWPSEWRVTRWHRAFPQPDPGHLDLVAYVHSAVTERLPGLALAGAAQFGVGIPACIESGRHAAATAAQAARPSGG